MHLPNPLVRQASVMAASATPFTVVIQTRVDPSKNADFSKWLQRINNAAVAHPGFLKETVIPPSPPVQVDWVILQRFASREAAVSWLRSDERQRLLTEARPMLVGQDNVNLVEDSEAGVLPAPVSAVISTRIRPGKEEAFLEWDRRIKAAQSKSPGFQGYRIEQPIPGVQDNWLTVLRFDSETHLQAWLDSPERKKLLEEASDFTEDCQVRIVRTGFDQWFDIPGAQSPPAWKQTMVLLLVLYPLAFLLNAWLHKPILVGLLDLPYWLRLFINIAIGFALLSVVVPWTSRRLRWWLSPVERKDKYELSGVALIIGLYALCLLVFWGYQSRFGAPF